MRIRTACVYSLLSVGVLGLVCSPLLLAQDSGTEAGNAESKDPFVKAPGGGLVADASGGGASSDPPAAGGEVADPDTPSGAADDPQAKNEDRAYVEPVFLLECIQTDLATANQLLVEFGDMENIAPLREKLEGMIDAGKAELIETCFLRSQNGIRAETKSVREHIYPTEFDPPDFPKEFQGKAASMPITSANPTAFDTRSVGMTFEIDATVGAGDPNGPPGRYIDINVAPEIVHYLGERSLVPGGGIEHRVVTQPDFEVMKLTTGIAIREGATSLLGVVRPSAAAGKRVLVMLSADTLKESVPERWPEVDSVEKAIQQSIPDKVVTHLEWIELEHREANRLLRKGWTRRDAGKLRAELGAMIEAGDASLVEASYIKTRNGQRAKVESGRLHLYPTEWDPAEIPEILGLEAAEIRPTGANPTALETRNVGTTVELDPVIGKEQVVTMNIALEIVEHLGDRGPGGDCPPEVRHIVQPEFYVMRQSSSLVAFVGQHNLIGSFTPSRDKNKRVLLLMKVDVLK